MRENPKMRSSPKKKTTFETQVSESIRRPAAGDWEEDTDVIPPEYGKQLLRISRRLRSEP